MGLLLMAEGGDLLCALNRAALRGHLPAMDLQAWAPELEAGAGLGEHEGRKAYRQGRKPSEASAGTVPSTCLLDHSTVTDLARLRGWSTSVPRSTAT